MVNAVPRVILLSLSGDNDPGGIFCSGDIDKLGSWRYPCGVNPGSSSCRLAGNDAGVLFFRPPPLDSVGAPLCLNPPEGIEWGMPYPGQSSYRLRAIMIPGGFLFLKPPSLAPLPLSGGGGLQHGQGFLGGPPPGETGQVGIALLHQPRP